SQLISLPGPIDEKSLAWSADGGMLAFAANSELEKVNKIVVVSAEGGEPQTVHFPEWKEITQIAWLRDNSGFVVSALEGTSWAAVPQYRLYRVSLSGGSPKLINDDLSSYENALDIAEGASKLVTIKRRQLNNMWNASAGHRYAVDAVRNSDVGKYEGL